jgi:hypothetical protein
LFAVRLPSHFSPTQQDVHCKIGILHRATMHLNSAEVNHLTTNMELLAFAISWFGMVSIHIVHSHLSSLTIHAEAGK